MREQTSLKNFRYLLFYLCFVVFYGWMIVCYLSTAYAQEVSLANPGNALISGINLEGKQEIIEERTKCSKTFLNLDGSFTFVTGIKPVHYQDIKGKWKEIDTKILRSKKYEWDYQMTENSWHVYFKRRFDEGPVLKYEHGDEWVTIQPASLKWISKHGQQELISVPQGKEAEVKANMIYYPEGYGSGLDMQYLLVPERIVEELIIRSKSDLPMPERLGFSEEAKLEINFAFEYSKGLQLWVGTERWDRHIKNKDLITILEGNISFVKDGRTLFYWPSPEFHDSSASLGEGYCDIYSHSPYHLERRGSRLYISVHVPKAWLDAAVYPVFIDPTFTAQPAAAEGIDTNVIRFDETSMADTDDFVRWQQSEDAEDWKCNIGLNKFDLSTLPGATINSATFYFYVGEQHWINGTLKCFRILPANSGWVEKASWRYLDEESDTGRWAGDIGNDGGTDAGCSQSGTDYDATPLGSTVIANAEYSVGAEFSQSWDLTEFGEMISANHGFVCHGEDANLYQLEVCTSDHATASYRPKLEVEYESKNSFFLNFP